MGVGGLQRTLLEIVVYNASFCDGNDFRFSWISRLSFEGQFSMTHAVVDTRQQFHRTTARTLNVVQNAKLSR